MKTSLDKMENYDNLRLQLESLNIPDDKIGQLIISLRDKEKKEKNERVRKGSNKDERFELANKLEQEKEWRQKAKLAARIISLKYED